MSSVPALAAWRLPVRAIATGPRLRRVLVVVAGLLVIAGTAFVAGDRERSHGKTAATGAATTSGAAHARAVDLAKANRAGAGPRLGTGATPAARPARVADASFASSLFATHSWYVPPPPPPPPPVVAPPPPTAPPFPYTFVGSFTPEGDKAVYFLSRGDRVTDAHVGDHIDGVYDFESADANQLVFNYLPLNIRQTLPIGAAP